jgi:O-antigen/teichoic acid export membrane protein
MVLGGEDYMTGVYCVPPIVLGVLCQYVYTHYVNIELHLKKTKFVSMGTIFAALLNIVLNAIFIPQYGFVAAAYTTFFSYVCLLFVHFGITRVILKVKLYNDFFMFGAVLVTGVIAVPLIYLYPHNLIRYGVAALGFASMLFVFRRFIKSYIEKLRSKRSKAGTKAESEETK